VVNLIERAVGVSRMCSGSVKVVCICIAALVYCSCVSGGVCGCLV